jgi:8-oxo-dGTP diphosphatase
MARKPIHAAGGIVVRGRARPRVAVVQRSKDERWVLPRGKLKRNENPLTGARREVVEETGHRVRIYEFLGAITYRTRGRPKVVQFWRMQAYERPSRDVMNDIAAVKWLTLSQAVQRLSYPLEKLFLQHAGPHVLKHGRRRKRRARRKTGRRLAMPTRRRSSSHASQARKPRARTGKAQSRGRRSRPLGRRRGASTTSIATRSNR